MNDKELDEISDKFTLLVSLLHQVRNTRGDVNGRGISVAITNVEQGHLWFEDAIKDVVQPT